MTILKVTVLKLALPKKARLKIMTSMALLPAFLQKHIMGKTNLAMKTLLKMVDFCLL